MSSSLYSGVSGLALGAGLYRSVSGLWGGASGLINGFGGGGPYDGASLYLDFLSMTAPTFDSRITFSRGSNATVVDNTGRVTYAPNNLLLRSQEFDNAAWTKTAVTATANATTSPDGTADADSIIETTANSTHDVNQSATLSAVAYTYSAFVKANGRSWVRLFVFQSGPGSTSVWFNVSTGVVGTVGAGASNATITNFGNGWYRCAFTFTAIAASASLYAQLATADNGASTYTGDGTSGVYLWGTQLEPVTYQTTPSAYVATTSAAYYGPRFDYDPVTLAPRGLLVEEARTNLLTYSAQFDNAFWQKTNITVTSAATVSPDGTTNAQRIAATASAATNIFSTNAAVAATSATYSVYVKQGTGPTTANSFAIRNNTTATTLLLVTVNLATGTVISYINGTTGASLQNAGNGWWRVVLTVTSGITSGDSLAGYVGFVGGSQTAGDHLFAWGAQLEAGAFATSYIPTVASTVTRSADVATMTGTNFSGWYNQSEGTFVVEADSGGNVSVNPIYRVLSAGSGNDRNTLFMYNGRWGGSTAVGGVVQADLQVTGTYTANVPAKTAFAFKANDFAASVNGSAVLTDTSGTVPTVAALNLGSEGGSGSINGHIREVVYFNTRQSNTRLQTLTAPPLVTTLSLDFTSGTYLVGY